MIESHLNFERDSGEFFLEALDSARRSVCGSVYKFRDPEILEALLRVRERGVDLRLVLDGRDARSGQSLARQAVHADVNVRLWVGEGGKLHAKFLVVDGRSVLTGSSNWTLSARASNVEILIRMEDAGAASDFGRHFERLWKGAVPFEERG